MNEKDLFALFQNGFTARNTSNSYIHLCNFVSAMRCGHYYHISDEDIHRGVECEKAQTNNKAKILFMGFPEDLKNTIDATSHCLQQFLNSKHTYEKQKNHVI